MPNTFLQQLNFLLRFLHLSERFFLDMCIHILCIYHVLYAGLDSTHIVNANFAQLGKRFVEDKGTVASMAAPIQIKTK